MCGMFLGKKGLNNVMQDRITAVVPARRFDNKLNNRNLLPFNGCTLMQHKIRQLKKSDLINEIVVSSEDEEVLELARQEGVTTIKRPNQYADIKYPFGEFVEYICEQLVCEHILWACVTAPFVTEKCYDQAIELYLDMLEEGYDSLITVQKLKRFILDRNGTVNFKRGIFHKDSDELSDLFLFTNGIALAPRSKMIEWKYNWGHIPYMLEIDKKTGIDISEAYDYELARLILEEEKRDGN